MAATKEQVQAAIWKIVWALACYFLILWATSEVGH